MVRGGYRWWYVDALSDDAQYGLTVIAFIGSVFSPYYAWAGRADPFNHCAVNVALYGPRARRWAMTERGRGRLSRSRDHLAIGPSALRWSDDALTIHVDEVAAPIPRRVRGVIRVEPVGLNTRAFELEAQGRHVWRPIAPLARVSIDLDAPELRWRGSGYFDTNAGDEPLEAGFPFWTWSRARLPDGAAILYDAERRRAAPLSLALRFSHSGDLVETEAPPVAPLPPTVWRLARRTRSDDGAARVISDFEDAPFYSRSLVASVFQGERAHWIHESLSLDRFANPIVKAMLPFRMPRVA